MQPHADREALIEALLQKMRKQLHEQLPDDHATLDQIEQAVEKIGSDLQRDLQQQLLQKRARQARDNQIECACGGRARYKAQEARTLLTRHGPLVWKRACYYCPACGKRFAPLDQTLGLDAEPTSPQVRLWCAYLGACLPFVQAAHALERLVNVSVSAATVERVCVRIGTALGEHQQQEADLHQRGRLPDQKTDCPRRLYVGLDGIFVPLRDAWKQDGSQGELLCRYGECKVGVVYEPGLAADGSDHRVETHAYVATLAGVEAFAPLLGTLAHRCGHHAAQEVVVLGDGAPWIWLLAFRQFPGAVQIVDFFHACAHLGAYAEARFGTETPDGQAWQQARQAQLKSNRLDLVLREILAWKPTNADRKKLRKNTYDYFYTNAERMRYQTFLERGYHIGSGVVEASCKQVVAQRLDQVGMHWRQETAEAIVTLRAAHCSSVAPDLRAYCAVPA